VARLIAVNAEGLRIGEDHPNAILTNAEVELVRRLHEDGMRYEDIAVKFELSKWAIGRICRYERRGQTVARWKSVLDSPGLTDAVQEVKFNKEQ
jgi:DNA invertase Pin-like site-specific DNA recombinase